MQAGATTNPLAHRTVRAEQLKIVTYLAGALILRRETSVNGGHQYILPSLLRTLVVNMVEHEEIQPTFATANASLPVQSYYERFLLAVMSSVPMFARHYFWSPVMEEVPARKVPSNNPASQLRRPAE